MLETEGWREAFAAVAGVEHLLPVWHGATNAVPHALQICGHVSRPVSNMCIYFCRYVCMCAFMYVCMYVWMDAGMHGCMHTGFSFLKHVYVYE